VTRAAKRISSDFEKTQLLKKVAHRYVLDDTLREAYLDVASTISSDHERAQALLALLDRDALQDPAVRRAYLQVIAGISSDVESRKVLSKLLGETGHR
jgi:hypothetical protein